MPPSGVPGTGACGSRPRLAWFLLADSYPRHTEALVKHSAGFESRDNDAGRIRAAWWAVLLTVAVALTTFHATMTSPWKLATPELMVDFEAAAPFQYRLLMPLFVGLLEAVMPLGVNMLVLLTEVAAWMLLVVVAYRSLEAFGVGASDLARRCLALTSVIPVAAHLIPPDIQFPRSFVVENGVLQLGDWRAYEIFNYIYDLPAAVLTLGLVLVLRRFVETLEDRWFAAYLGLFVIATLNRETAVFVIPAFLAVCYPVLRRSVLAAAAALQVIVFLAIQLTMQWWFADNVNPHANVPGTSYENHLLGNLALLSHPLYLAIYLARLGAGMYLPIALLHRYLDPFLGRTLLWFGVPFVASTFLFGRLQEHRVLVEIAPLLWLGAVQAVAQRASGPAPSTAPPSKLRFKAPAMPPVRPVAVEARSPEARFEQAGPQ